jgi:hypothetical protein
LFFVFLCFFGFNSFQDLFDGVGTADRVSACTLSPVMSDDEHDHDDGKPKKEWVRTVATHLKFISGFNAFPGKKPGGLNPSMVFDAVQVRAPSSRSRDTPLEHALTSRVGSAVTWTVRGNC